MNARPTLLLYHGWAFDSSVWDALAERLADWPVLRMDAGYFGPRTPLPADLGPVVVIAHSYGFMRFLSDVPASCVAAISINGFARFCAAPGQQGGTPAKILDRMITRFAQDPHAVLAQFRERCGAHAIAPALLAPALGQDLANLRFDDRTEALDHLRVPLLALASGGDEIVSRPLTETTFSQRNGCELRWFEEGDHLLPLSAPDWCAAQIQAFLDRAVARA